LFRQKIAERKKLREHYDSIFTGHEIIVNTDFSHERTNAVGDVLLWSYKFKPGEMLKFACDQPDVFAEDTMHKTETLRRASVELVDGFASNQVATPASERLMPILLHQARYIALKPGVAKFSFSYSCAFNKEKYPDRSAQHNRF
jgi:hypothetical protein